MKDLINYKKGGGHIKYFKYLSYHSVFTHKKSDKISKHLFIFALLWDKNIRSEHFRIPLSHQQHMIKCYIAQNPYFKMRCSILLRDNLNSFRPSIILHKYHCSQRGYVINILCFKGNITLWVVSFSLHRDLEATLQKVIICKHWNHVM